MLNEKKEIEEIKDYIGRWLMDLSLSNALSYFDINKESEGFCLQLLNLTYGYKLVDLNTEKANFPGIDLADETNSMLAFQVTTRTDFQKIKHSIKLFYQNDLQKKFPAGIRFLILNNNKIRIGSLTQLGDKFDKDRDIVYPADLIQSIIEVYRTDNERYLRIKALLHRELDRQYGKQKRSVLQFPDPCEHIAYYTGLFREVNKKEITCFVDLTCHLDGHECFARDAFDQIAESSSVIIDGASGCGKSALAKFLSFNYLDQNIVPLFLEGKYYDADLDALINGLVIPFGFSSGSDFFECCSKCHKKIVIILDGLNECHPAKQDKVIAELVHVSNTHGIRFVITTQILDGSLTELDGKKIFVPLPSLETKKAVAEKYSKSSDKLDSVLSVVTNTLEAKIVGEIGAADVEKISRSNLFEMFIRKKLERTNPKAYGFLSVMAGYLSEQVAFSLSFRTMEQLLKKEKLSIDVYKDCLASGLIAQNLTKISFAHELILGFFVADNVVRSSKNSASLIKKLNAPKNKDKQLMIVGAIDDLGLLYEVLESITNVDLLISLYQGDGGEFNQHWVNAKISKLIENIEKEAAAIKFEITEDRLWPVKIVKESVLKWSLPEIALIYTIPDLLQSEKYLKVFFDIIAVSDKRCEQQFKVLQEEAKQKQVSLRSGIFSAMYVGLGVKEAAITRIFSTLHSGYSAFHKKNIISREAIAGLLNQGTLSNGQFYLLLLLFRYDERAQLLFPYVLDTLEGKLKFKPYHLKIEILDRVPYCFANEEQRVLLIEKINKIHAETTDAWTSTILFDALSGLGALEEDAEAYEETVAGQLEQLLEDPENERFWSEASGLYYARFDHPYDTAFYNAIAKLSTEKKEIFYKMALRGHYSSFFTTSLIFDALSVLGTEIGPYLYRYIADPQAEQHAPQDSLAVFLIANILLGRLSLPIKSLYEHEPDIKRRILLACGDIYYWINRADLNVNERKNRCREATKVVFDKDSGYAVNCIWQAEHSLSTMRYDKQFTDGAIVFFSEMFQDQVADMCREALLHQGQQHSVIGFENHRDIIAHAIALLTRFGNSSDILILRKLTEHPEYGSSAVDAIKHLEG
ncbi:SMEK domain-containing protein [Mucilaginibacter sp. UC70_90]